MAEIMFGNEVKLHPRWLGILCGLGISAIALSPQSVGAQSSELVPSAEPLEVKLLQEGTSIPENVVTETTISQTDLTVPSLWWTDEQFGDKLLDRWLAYTDKKRIDLVVNRQIWSLMDYFDRYAFLNRIGATARDFEYDVRVFNRETPESPLAAYTCSYDNAPLQCRIWFGISEPSGFRGTRDTLF